ncbi:MAG TPA: hypothetical protein VMW24_14655 [Sedimentisphaerales bacterium]|nr:hypothetical protein [Sedimentisphaerales bacterium]
MVGGRESSQLLDGLLFPGIFQAFRMSIQPTKLIITSCALAVICLAGWIMDFSKTVPVVRDGQGKIVETELQICMANLAPDVLRSEIQRLKESGDRSGVFSILWNFAGAKFKGAVDSVFDLKVREVWNNIHDCFKAVAWSLLYHPVYCIIFFIIKLAVISIAGGAVCRIAALQFARGEKPGLTEALRFSTKRFTSFFTAPLAPIGIMAFIGLFIILLGLAGNIPRVGELIVGIGMPLVLAAGFLIAVILIGAVVGFNLMFPAVAYDGSDCFDAISRSFSYIYARPWRMGFYTVIAAVYGSICYTFVRFLAFLSLWITHWFLQLSFWAGNGSGQVNKLVAIWPKPEVRTLLGSSGPLATNWTEAVAVFLARLFVLLVVGLVVSFIISFYFSANTIIYSLMRNRVDNTAREDIYMPYDEPEVEPGEVNRGPDHQEKSASKSESTPDSSSCES